jgi:hypothetical protein
LSSSRGYYTLKLVSPTGQGTGAPEQNGPTTDFAKFGTQTRSLEESRTREKILTTTFWLKEDQTSRREYGFELAY